MKTLRTSMTVVGGAMIFVALVADWIGLSTPESFGGGQILLLSAGIVVLLIAFLSRADDAPDLRSFGHRLAESYRKVAVLTLSALVLVALVELAAIGVSKILRPAKPGVAISSEKAFSREKVSYYTSQDWAAQYWDEHRQSIRERYHPYVLWRRVPFKGKTINIDPQGVRLTPGADCSANSYRVFAFGGATMWGTGSPDWGTIPAYLQAGLEARRGKPVCVVNFGETGFVATQEVIQLLLQLESGNVPHLVIFYDGINDVYAAYQSGQAGVHENLDPIAAKLEGGSTRIRFPVPPQWLETWFTFSLLKSLVAKPGVKARNRPKLLNYVTRGIDITTLSNSIVQNYLGKYEVVSALAQKYGFNYFFFWQPVVSVGEKPLTREEQTMKHLLELQRGLGKLYDAVYQTMELESSNYENLYYLGHIFDKYDSTIWIDEWHVTPVGNQLIAQKMLDVVTASNQGRK
jgi:hypothetical protein